MVDELSLRWVMVSIEMSRGVVLTMIVLSAPSNSVRAYYKVQWWSETVDV